MFVCYNASGWKTSNLCTKAATSNIATLPIIGSTIISQQVYYFENSPISVALKGQSLHAFRYLYKFQACKMTASMVILFVLKFSLYVFTPAVSGGLEK